MKTIDLIPRTLYADGSAATIELGGRYSARIELKHENRPMRHVYPTTEVIHKWAHQTQSSARNAGGNVFFRDSMLFSYGEHFMMGRIHRAKGRAAPLVLLNSSTYSKTTSKHQSFTWRAVSHLDAISVPRPARYGKSDDAPNVDYLLARIAEECSKASRAMNVGRVQSRASSARSYHKAAEQYCAFFKVRRKLPDLPDFDLMIERARRISNPDPASADKRERARAQRAAAKLARDAILRDVARIAAELREVHNAARRTDWRLHGAFESHGHFNRAGLTSGPVMLRVTEYADAPAAIETSQGASIPLAAAPMVWSLVERSRVEGGRTFQGHIKIGDYAVNEITADGDLRVGCHTIPHSELRSMARALGLS